MEISFNPNYHEKNRLSSLLPGTVIRRSCDEEGVCFMVMKRNCLTPEDSILKSHVQVMQLPEFFLEGIDDTREYTIVGQLDCKF